MYAMAALAKRCELDNKVPPGLPKLTDSERDSTERFKPECCKWSRQQPDGCIVDCDLSVTSELPVSTRNLNTRAIEELRTCSASNSP